MLRKTLIPVLLMMLPVVSMAQVKDLDEIKVLNANRIDDAEQVVQFVDSNLCKYVGEMKEVGQGWIINVKQRICKNQVEPVNMIAYPNGRYITPIPIGKSWLIINRN
ncbi:hypothetical protein [Providencia rettgeri]|uniref:hypothetical protein n=1 Tax=Providencia rettgeri TaxID=587 RepID=UPI0024B9D14B|nr:hypothetical protein [Providencia rettgeri]WHT81919.1 hypothetical protein KOL65_22035 [Providencia rettgeri]